MSPPLAATPCPGQQHHCQYKPITKKKLIFGINGDAAWKEKNILHYTASIETQMSIPTLSDRLIPIDEK